MRVTNPSDLLCASTTPGGGVAWMPTLLEPTAWGWGGAVFHSQGSGAGEGKTRSQDGGC